MLMKDERFFKTIKNFLEIYLLKQKNYSKNTQKSYRESLSLLLQYFKEELGLGYARISFDDLTYTNVCGFLDSVPVQQIIRNYRKRSCAAGCCIKSNEVRRFSNCQQ